MAQDLLRSVVVASLVILCAISLQGCSVKVPRHSLGNWEAERSYLVTYQFTPPGSARKPILNSCSDPNISPTMVCSGHGRCKDWTNLAVGEAPGLRRLSFCECDPDWADPECRTPRKSQVTAYLLAVFFGFLGADQFYLGYFYMGLAKMLTFGGVGLVWLYDICRIGSHAPTTTGNFRVTHDLPHYAFVLSSIIMMLTIGFFLAIRSIQANRIKKAHELMLMRLEQQQEEDSLREQGMVPDDEDRPATRTTSGPPYSMASQPLKSGAFTGYGSVLPRAMPMTAGPAFSQQPMNTSPFSRSVNSWRPAPTMPPQSTAPGEVTPLTPVATATLPPRVMSSMPPTEYSPRGSVITSSPVLPVVRGMGPASTALPGAATAPAIRPVSSVIL